MLQRGMWTTREKGRMKDLVSLVVSMSWGSLGQWMCKGLFWTCGLEETGAPDPRSSPHRSSPPAQLLT